MENGGTGVSSESGEMIGGENQSSMYKRGGHVSKGEMVWKKLNDNQKLEFLYQNFTPEITPRSQEILVSKPYNFLPKNVKIKFEAKYANVENYGEGGGTGVSSETGTPIGGENQSSMFGKGGNLKPIPKGNKGLPKLPKSVRNKMGYMENGGGVGGYKLTLKSWHADVYEDDYNQGEGKNVNSFNEKVNKSFSSGEELLKYISDFVVYHPLKKEDYSIMDDGRIVTSVLVDEDNSSASAREVEEWKNGNKKLYSENYNFYVTLTQEKKPTADELSKLLGIGIYKKGGKIKKFANGGKMQWGGTAESSETGTPIGGENQSSMFGKGGSTSSFEYTIGGL